MNKSLTNLLEDCTVRIEVGDSFGTGFFVAPGTVLTCAHVVKPETAKKSPVKVVYKKKTYKSERIIKKEILDDEYPDLALFKVNISDHPCVYLDDDFQLWDKFYSFGYTTDQINGEGVTVECEGSYDGDRRLMKLKEGQIQHGFSGSPLLNARTERVNGMLQMSRDPDKERGGFAFPMENINKFFPDLLERNRKFHDENSQWEDACGQSIKRSISNPPIIYEKPGTVVERGKHLFGRSILLDEIFGFLCEGKRVLLTGITGIGKTFLAENLTEKWLQEVSKPVAWLKVGYQDQDAIQDSLMEINAKMGANRSQYDKAQGENKRLALLSLFEESAIGLLVFDDVRNMAAMTVALRAIPERIPILITSRQFLDIDEIIDVDENQLQLSDAIALLEHYAGGKNYSENPDANKLCNCFECHPLALELCGSIMRRQDRSPQALLKKLAPDPLNLTKPGHIGLRALLEDSFEDLNQQSRLVFTGFGAFYENGVTSAYLGNYLNMPLEVLGEALDDLFNYNLVKFQPETEFYYMHDLIFTYSQTLARTNDQVMEKLIESTLKYLKEYTDDYELLSLDMPNLLSIADRCEPIKLVEIISWLTIGGYPQPGPDSYFENKGHPGLFLARLDKAIQASRNISDCPKATLHYLLGKRGDSYFNIGDYKDAISCYEDAISLAPDIKRRIIVMGVAARTYAIFGEQHKSQMYFQEAYELARQIQDELLLVKTMGQESLAASNSGDYKKIKEISERQVEIAQRIINIKPSSQASRELFFALLNLGTAEMDLSKQGDGSLESALPILVQAKQIALDQKNDVLMAYICDSLGEIYHYMENKTEAMSYFLRSLQLWKRLGMLKDIKELEIRMQSLGYSVSQ